MEIQITYRHCDSSEVLSEHVRTTAKELEKFANDLRSCKAVIERPHHKDGVVFHAKLLLEVVGADLVAEAEDPNAYSAVTEAFKAAERQLQVHTDKRRHDVKRHTAR